MIVIHVRRNINGIINLVINNELMNDTHPIVKHRSFLLSDTMLFAFNTILISLLLICFTPSCKKKDPLFSLLPSGATNVHFINTLTDSGRLNFLDYLYYYNGGGVAAGDINNDGLTDIYFTANSRGGNKLYVNKGNFVFEDITEKAGVNGISDWCTGVTMVDINADGLLDIYVCAVVGKLTLEGHNQLFINKGNNRFVDESSKYGLDFRGFSTQAAFFDYDKDGLLDCYLLNQSMHSLETYGDTTVRKIPNELSGDRLYKNVNGHFENVSLRAGIYSSALGYGLGLSIADINNDGWDDIYVGNDFHENDYYYVNNKNGTFTESGAEVFGHYSRFSMGNDIADYNNDGQLDIFTCDMLPYTEEVLKTYASDDQSDIYDFKIRRNGFQNQYSHNCLQKNMGNGAKFSELAFAAGVAATDWSWSPLLADFNNDGIKDLFITAGIIKRPADLDYIKFISDADIKYQLNDNRQIDVEVLRNMPGGRSSNFIFEGNKNEIFTDQSKNWGIERPGFSNGAAYADLNNDGALDLVVNNINEPAFIYKNNIVNKNYLSVSFKGMPNNTYGLGAKLYLFTKAGMQYQQLYSNRGFQSSSQPILHFGIDTLKNIDSMLLVWPDLKYQLVRDLKINQAFTALYKNATGFFESEKYFPSSKEFFTDITIAAGIDYTHKENGFVDFNVQYFIPHKISTQGPKLAVADVNGDGLDDFFVCGASNNSGQLYLQTPGSRFIKAKHPVPTDTTTEQVAALFIDTDNDGDMDLYVVSGGNEQEGQVASLLDHLYINNGKSDFTESKTLPAFYGNKSVVCAADIDSDGDQDLFIGGRGVAKLYGLVPQSFLLINDGKGNFSLDTLQWGKALRHIGMVTGASFTDLNKDKKPDLILAGEWMPVTYCINSGKGFNINYADKKALTGWWQTVQTTDINKDGYDDIIAGNYGLNAKLKAAPTAPVKLYLQDFDSNGQVDPILTTTDIITGKEYPFLLKDELERQLPLLKKEFLYYRDFAGKTVQEIWKNKLDGAVPLKAQTFESMVFINNQKGGFDAKALPLPMQLAPVFCFAPLTVNYSAAVLYAGNFFGAMPYEGNYDALMPALYIYSTEKILNTPMLNSISGELRDIKLIRLGNKKKGVLFARNNAKLLLLQY
ncbi:MAG: VCBS repeat-containing protein [Ferruginibacter sp.]|nr:VCBS repeat-containing protein [Ferruginibacter sp.]